MIVALSALAGTLTGIVLCAIGRSDDQPVTRRAWLRLAILGATGLSLVPGCGGDGRPPDSLLNKWARLGRIWRDLSTHLRDQRGDWGELESRMRAALDALPASPELRLVFEERYTHIGRLLYGPTCYLPPPPGCTPAPQFVVEDQVAHLEKLLTEGRLSERAALRAAGVLAIQAEYMVQENETEGLPWDEREPILEKLNERYCNGTLKARWTTMLAGQRLVELTVDDLGWLAGPPSPNEGVTEAPAAADVPEEEADP